MHHGNPCHRPLQFLLASLQFLFVFCFFTNAFKLSSILIWTGGLLRMSSTDPLVSMRKSLEIWNIQAAVRLTSFASVQISLMTCSETLVGDCLSHHVNIFEHRHLGTYMFCSRHRSWKQMFFACFALNIIFLLEVAFGCRSLAVTNVNGFQHRDSRKDSLFFLVFFLPDSAPPRSLNNFHRSTGTEKHVRQLVTNNAWRGLIVCFHSPLAIRLLARGT